MLRRRRMAIVGATSGDTGSAAIAGVRGKPNIECFILYPNGSTSSSFIMFRKSFVPNLHCLCEGTSRVQELQMVTVPDANIHCFLLVLCLPKYKCCEQLVISHTRTTTSQTCRCSRHSGLPTLKSVGLFLCPYATLKTYNAMTKQIRQHSGKYDRIIIQDLQSILFVGDQPPRRCLLAV